MYDIVIIGGGPAGLTAALYAKRYGMDILVLESAIYGGQVTNTPEVENYPGIKSIAGADFAFQLYEQIVNLGVEIRLEGVEQVDFTGPVKVIKTIKDTYEARTVIIANGAKRRKLLCVGEAELTGKGVSYCATCDGAFFRGKDVAIVGGGNTALEDALFLANNCRTVHLVHRRDAFRGNKILSDAVVTRENIHIHYDSVVDEIYGHAKVEGIVLRNVKNDQTQDLPLAGVFVAVGLEPDNKLLAGQVELDRAGYIVAGEDCKTSLAGVYAAGDTRTKELRQIITAAADGAVAAFEASNLINAGA